MIEELYREYGRGLWRYALSIAKDKHKADDILQDAFVKLMGKEDLLKTLRPQQREAYLVITLRHTAYSYLKKWAEYYPLGLDEAKNEPFAVDQFLRIAEREEMSAALATLNQTQRDVLNLHYYMGLPYREIAQMLNIKIPHARVIAFHARKALRNYFTTEDKADGEKENPRSSN